VNVSLALKAKFLENIPPKTIFDSLIKEVPIAIARQERGSGIDDRAPAQGGLGVRARSQ
jgi:hypothetical protein